MSAQQALPLPSPAASNTVVINSRCSLRIEAAQRANVVAGLLVHRYCAEDAIAEAYAMVFLVEQGFARQTEVARGFARSVRTVRRHQRRYVEGGMAALGRDEGWRRGRRRISGKRLRTIEMLKSQGMSNRAIAHRLGVSEMAIRKLVGPSKPADIAQPTFAGITTGQAEQQPAIDAPSAESTDGDPDRAAPPADDRAGVFKRLKVIKQAERIRAEPPPLPGRGPYRFATVDFPLAYEIRQDDPSHRAARPYPTMNLDQILQFAREKIRPLMHDDSVLALWSTNFHLIRYAAPIIDAAGFSERTILTWVKTNNFGHGDYLRSQTEHCVIAIRGAPTVTLTNESTVLFAPARGHSVKPPEFYALMESAYPAPRYADLFSRYRHNDKWDCHGDEAPAAEPEPPPPREAATEPHLAPRVLNVKDVGRKTTADRVFVGRPSKWGNHKFKLRRNATPEERAEVIAKYRAKIVTQPALMAALHELRGKDLVCYCAPLPCHGDVLLELANAPREEGAS
jgi:N6-adenosine-specific RNA methylase IME4/transposase